MIRLQLAGVLLLAGCAGAPARPAGERPNILWITVEDMSPAISPYGDAFARTPNLDRFARESVRYDRAFATAPVCSPARSCLITGMYATTLGTQRLRSAFPVPPHVRGFPAWLREAGYYCANNVKTDYNVADEPRFIADAWDDSSPRAHWRGRPPGRPFFAVVNDMTTHQTRMSAWPREQFVREVQSRLSPDEIADPAKVPLPPYYPDTAAARETLARAYDCIAVMDQNVGRILKELADDGLADDTIVFFFSDHGHGLPRHKRVLHDSGMRVPLMVRFPPKYAHLAPAPPGSAVDRLVSFVDMAPAVLALAGVERPSHLQGVDFLRGRPRPYVFGARDRIDEAFDVARSVHDGRWLYIRNYMPHLPWHQPSAFSDQSEFAREMVRREAGQRRSLEELYDSETDPHQVRNLAADPAQQGRLEAFRMALRAWIRESKDVGFLPETEAWRRAGSWGAQEEVVATAELVGTTALGEQLKRLESPDPAVRYWAAMGIGAQTLQRDAGALALQDALADPSSAVRIEAAGARAQWRFVDGWLPILTAELKSDDLDAALHACRTIELLGKAAAAARPAMEELARRVKDVEGDRAMFLRFSTEAFLTKR